MADGVNEVYHIISQNGFNCCSLELAELISDGIVDFSEFSEGVDLYCDAYQIDPYDKENLLNEVNDILENL